ncbi:tape measure protein [Pantoea coffeiphila]|uniref:tape measure protein n=1 Tax=Pantoea coffeiphila TaxID=1465635 RepID=UPI0019616BD9|nr:tape measure protein [Pantoea coffeiphila]MBM7342717.1 tape measure domain-containing protein [Pantoea coffeiphila]
MAGSFNAGSVIYEVDMDTHKLIEARRQVEAALNGMGGSMGRLEANINRTERAVDSASRTMSSLSSVAKGLLAALSIQQVGAYADAWTVLNNKVANSVKQGEQQAEVMKRIFDISQATQSSLNGTATLYARLERGTRLYNTSAEDLTKLTTIINQGFAVSGATAQEAENAIVQLSQGLAAGALRGEEFNSVSEQGSRLTIALADSLGVTLGQLRAMAAEGKLTTEVIVNGLLSQGDTIGKEFAKTTVSISQGLLVAGNNVTKFFGENSTVKSFAAGFRDSVITISENLEMLSVALIAAAAVMGGRFTGAMVMATASQVSRIRTTIQSIAATRQSAQQEAAAAAVTLRKADADKAAALSALNLATAEYNVARGSAAEAIALENVIRLRGIYVATAAEAALANNALAASQAKVAATGITLSNTMKVINTVTAPLGGPIGVLAIVAAGWYLYAQRQAEARKESIAFADTLPNVIQKLKEMNLAQAQGVRADTITSLKNQKEEITELESHISDLNEKYKERIALAKPMGLTDEKNNGHLRIANDLTLELAKANRDLAGKNATLNQTNDALKLINIQVNKSIVDQMKAARDNAMAVAEAEKQASFLGGTQAFLAEKLGQTTAELQKFNAESLKINWGGTEGEKLIKQAERRLELSKLEGEAKARLQAKYDAEDAKVTDPLAIKKLQDKYAATEKNTQARKDQTKEDNAATSAANKLANQHEAVTQKLASLQQQAALTADSTQELTRAQAIQRAGESLGSAATPEQVKQAHDYAAAIWDTAAAIKARNAVPELKENADYTAQKSQLEMLKNATDSNGKLLLSQDQYNQASEQLEQDHQDKLAQIRAGKVVTPQQQSAGMVDPVQALANEQARKLALIQAFEKNKTLTQDQALALRNAAETQYEQQRIAAQWETWRNQSAGNEALAASFDALAGNASNALTGMITGSMSASEAMRSLGSTVLNSLVNTFVQMGVEWVKSAVMGSAAQQAGVAASTATQIGGIAATTAASTTAAGATMAAWLPAALVASVGSFGAAAIVGGAALASAFALSKVMGRKNGGQVSAGGLYEFGEGNLPEVLQMGGKSYMLPGNNGRVFSNSDVTGGAPMIKKASTGSEYLSNSKGNPAQNDSLSSKQVQVNVQFYDQTSGGQHSFEAQARQEGNVVTVDAFLRDFERAGPMSSQVQRTFGLNRKANGSF